MMMIVLLRRVSVALGLITMFALNAAPVQAAAVKDYIPNAQLVGEAQFKVVFFKIYDAALFATDGEYSRSKPFALRIKYLVDADKERIVKQSIAEMERQKAAKADRLAEWRVLMEETFTDIKENDLAYMVQNDDRTLTLWTNDEEPVTITDKGFARAFLNIWVGRKARDKDFQRQLFGQN